MSFPNPHGTPAYPASRSPSEKYWQASRNSPGANGLGGYGFSQPAGVTNNLNNFFSGDRSLPMYKDKPYFAPRRTGPRLRRRRVFQGVILVFALVSLYYFVSGSSNPNRVPWTPDTAKGEALWRWIENVEAEQPYDGIRLKNVDWEARREKVRDAFIVSWDGYEQYAWGFDEFHPVAKKGKNMVEGGMGWQIVDALDTMMIMNLTSRVQHARTWIHNSLTYDADHDVNTFETTIRMLGGLLSAHYLSTTYPDLASITDDDIGSAGEDLYIEKATDLAERLLGAFDSATGIPYASVNLNTSIGIPSHSDRGASSTAEATTVQLEFKYLAKLTGEAEYWHIVEKVMQLVDQNQAPDGLLPIFIYADTGNFRGANIRLGSRGDSYYEYLIKQYLQTSEEIYRDMWDEALLGIRKHLITYTKNAKLTVLGERQAGLDGPLTPKMDHLACFLPGSIALGATGGLPLTEAKKSTDWTRRKDEEILLAKELMKTCWATYLSTRTGLAPEITYFEIDTPHVTEVDRYPDSTLAKGTAGANNKPADKDLPSDSQPLYPLKESKSDPDSWRSDITIRTQDRHNLQRPETVESLLYLYRITGDETYRHWGWEMFKSFIKHTAILEKSSHYETEAGDATTYRIVSFTSLSNVNTIPAPHRDNMESFWMGETLKYFYLLFSDKDFISLEDNVFNTEAHPMPRFKTGGELVTGWARAPRVPVTAGGRGAQAGAGVGAAGQAAGDQGQGQGSG
ncbi:glycoside hydrolase family 47 protein [Aspergillus stella-maris]|uniref:glycoside hydrolase family 47 protein n=1 Tax=Aspergillus stella-maris TaxID=1810926 RepID=UPI003CCCAFDE